MIMIYKAACKYFGLEVKFGIEDFLPESAVRELKIDSNKGAEQEALFGAVQKIYRIAQDNARLRRILEKPPEKRGEFFDGLRKNYPVRREFQNTKVIIKDRNESLAKKLKGIGFLLSQSLPRT